MNTVCIDADVTYELDVESFSPGSRPSRDDPGDGAEIEFGPFVKVWLDPKNAEDTTFAAFLLNYASSYAITLREAERRVQDEAIECLLQRMADEYDDRDC